LSYIKELKRNKKNIMQWINFVHLYQPANTNDYYVKEAAENSYARILRALQANSNIKFTININACLLYQLDHLGYKWLIDGFKKLYEKKQIEVVSTAAYHPVIPLLPVYEIRKQILEQENALKKYLNVQAKPKGFFFPEMAYSPQAAKIIKDLGYEWIILDEIAYQGQLDEVDFKKVYLDKNSQLKVIFRSRRQSNTYVPDLIFDLKDKEKKSLIITATDAELYGLRHQDPSAELEKALKIKELKTETISDYIKDKEVLKIKPVACSWESMPEELQANQPYILWNGKNNSIHKELWKLANLALVTLKENKKDENYNWGRWHLVRGLASCTFWWASAKDFKHNFGPYAWNPDEIERGLEELIRSIRSLENEKLRTNKLKAEKIYLKVKALIWKKHWQYYWKK
jgi:predicted glycosyl hydrolase (DUF1957 family)